jgi:hypothetical protein
MLQLTKVWYSDENALARQKMLGLMVRHVTPLFTQIIHQGAQEGVFTTSYPEYASQVIINLVQPLGDTFAQMLLSEEAKHNHAWQKANVLVAAYNDAVERILGAPQGSIQLMDTQALKEWFPAEDTLPSQNQVLAEEAGLSPPANP